jgi:hypothetical protein
MVRFENIKTFFNFAKTLQLFFNASVVVVNGAVVGSAQVFFLF